MKTHASTRYPKWRSMTYRLPAAYALIALLVVLVLGAVLFMSLRGYYANQERAYLEAHSEPMAKVLGSMLLLANPDDWQSQVNLFSFMARAQVDVLDTEGQVLVAADIFEADPIFAEGQASTQGFFISAEKVDGALGFNYLLISPQDPNTLVLEDRNTIRLSQAREIGQTDLAFPVEETMQNITFSSATDADVTFNVIPTDFGGPRAERAEMAFFERSDVTLDTTIVTDDGRNLGILRMSNGPAYGGIIIRGVMSGWLLASFVSVALALVLGWIASRDVVNPLQTLSMTTKRMAEGDLAARVQIQREDEFGSLAQSFNHMANQIEKTISTLQRFVSDAAHEINTPITALRTNLELMEGQEVERALGQLQRLQDLSSKLLQLSRLESDIEESSVELIEANAIAQEVGQFYASQAEQSDITLNLELSPSPLYFKANRAQMQTALANLVHNAIKFTPKEGNVRISVQGNANKLRFTIEDTGIGIPEADLAFLFSRFHRGRNAARYAGNGLGLAIVHAIVTRYGGRVYAENLERGTRFTLELTAEKAANQAQIRTD